MSTFKEPYEPIPQFEDYQDRIVAFVDFQGFAARIKDIGDDKNKFNAIANVLYRSKTLEDLTEPKLQFFPDSIKQQIKAGYQCTALSDSIAFSFPTNSYPEYAFLLLSIELAALQWVLLSHDKFLIRGYIAEGKCYHKNGIIFGPAYQDAYFGAEKNSIHTLPYILIQDELIYQVKQNFLAPEVFDALYKIDHLKRYFINYATVNNLQTDPDKAYIAAEKARDFINKNFEQASAPDIRDKYFWTFQYLNENCNLLKQKALHY
jgi:hypothetical protein